MRLDVLDHGHKLHHKLLFHIIRFVTKHPVPDVLKLIMYRGAFFGRPMSAVFQAALRGPSEWSVGQRELMAAWVSKKNECEF